MNRSGPDRLDRIRAIPLETVASALGYRSDPRDPRRWKRDGSILSIDGTRFYDHLNQRGGGGAIDLVIHATGCRFPDALRLLDGLAPQGPDTPHERTASAPPRKPRKLRLPPDAPSAWPGVQNALVRNRALPADLLDAWRARGMIRADRRQNAVFICRNAAGRITGAELLGTRHRAGERPFRGMAPGSRKAKGGFHIPCGAGPPATVILTESAIDALSAQTLAIEPTRQTAAVLVSTAGVATDMPPWIEDWKPQRIVCAYDADAPGDQAARSLARDDPRVTRFRPQGTKDWNDILKKQRTP